MPNLTHKKFKLGHYRRGQYGYHMPSVIGIRFGLGSVNSTRSVGGRPVRFLPFHCRDRQLGQMLGGFFERVCQEYPHEPWAKATFGKSSPKTWLDFYRVGLRAIRNYRPLASLQLDEITSERAAEFAAYRQSQGLQVSTVNSSLRVLRRMLRLAVEWGELPSAPTIKRLPGERHREHVVSYDEEARYLGAGSALLASISTVLIDTGMRPEECYRLRWESITSVNGRNGTLLVTHGKTAAARRMLPMTPRVRAILENRWERTGRLLEGWVWPAPTMSGHVCPASSILSGRVASFRNVTEQSFAPTCPMVHFPTGVRVLGESVRCLQRG